MNCLCAFTYTTIPILAVSLSLCTLNYTINSYFTHAVDKNKLWIETGLFFQNFPISETVQDIVTTINKYISNTVKQ